MLQSAARLRIISPAPMSSTTAIAISTATKTLCVRCRAPLDPRPPSFSVSCMSGRIVFSAGTSPNTIPVTTEIPRVKNITRPSSPISSDRGKVCGSAARIARVPHFASNSPIAPPTIPSITLSVKSCRITRLGLAPSAERIANSRERPVDRASSKFATFAHAINNTKLTAPSSTSRIPRTLPTTSVFNGTRAIPVPLSASG